ncbi:hypothetical protein BGZ61DRAFT_501316 [Ilyonectria robusta]|uniref:uncharacterized protein n=1 Tax=Ilyonectria robusta TaxID=1079257 RepID=UPI001E8DA365|nr:uncharacterized protein BGZ61DRAFT_501316 [Ilyonectria robusta]KAH8646432.1 hypothetical protein BGZ61DRAFT_501316 [Ilyonectria robusta]
MRVATRRRGGGSDAARMRYGAAPGNTPQEDLRIGYLIHSPACASRNIGRPPACAVTCQLHLHKVDTGNPTNLISMWTDSVDQGRRLENLSWRLWQRETFDCQSASNKISPQPLLQNIPYESCIPGPLQLSGSVESLTDEKADDFTSVPIPVDTCCPKTRIQGSYTSCRSKRERHISSDDFERMAVSILKDKSPLLILLQSCPMVATLKESLPAPIALERSSSSTTKSQSPSKSISNRLEASPEFAPITPSRTIINALSDRIPKPTSSPAPKPVQSKKHKPVIPNIKRLIFQIGGSPEDNALLKSTLATSPPSSLFSLQNNALFITLILAKDDRAHNLGNYASQSTTAIPRSRIAPNKPSLGASRNELDETPLIIKGMRHPTLKPIHEIPRSSPQSIHKKPDHAENQAALSPHTTRRNMLATELTESLRRHLLWERQQKSSTADAVLSRSHTSDNMTHLEQHLKKSCIKTSEDVSASSKDQCFFKNVGNGYHVKGW